MKQKKRKRTINNRSALAVALFFLVLGVSLAKDKEKAKKPESFSVIAGTVFRPPGFALPGAEVTLKPEKGKGNQLLKEME